MCFLILLSKNIITKLHLLWLCTLGYFLAFLLFCVATDTFVAFSLLLLAATSISVICYCGKGLAEPTELKWLLKCLTVLSLIFNGEIFSIFYCRLYGDKEAAYDITFCLISSYWNLVKLIRGLASSWNGTTIPLDFNSGVNIWISGVVVSELKWDSWALITLRVSMQASLTGFILSKRKQFR